MLHFRWSNRHNEKYQKRAMSTQHQAPFLRYNASMLLANYTKVEIVTDQHTRLLIFIH
jgi:hypothetical protein